MKPKPVLGAVMLAVIALVASACGSSHAASGSTVSSSGPMLGGKVQCTATLPTAVRVGDLLDVVFTFHNVSKRPVNVYLGTYGSTWAVVRSPDGTTYDTRVPLEDVSVPNTPSSPLAPGTTTTKRVRFFRVHWEGPLRITPGCGLSPLPPVRVPVTSPGLPASERAALNAVVAATGHLLDHCRPKNAGVSVVGTVAPPKVLAPPLPARCSISLHRKRGFYFADVLIISPANLRGVHVEPPYWALSGLNVGNRNTEAITWQFVVTRDGATSVGAGEGDTTVPANRMATHWRWSGSEWQLESRSRCGGSGGVGGGVDGADVVLISVCRR